ncbi:MAG: SDR family oxidoreductase [bacterium]|nr:SDR family oxidoreductase [bacterium]
MAIPLSPAGAGTAPGLGRLRGRHVLVVGAGRETWGMPDPPPGNGQAIARLAAREGAAVACADLVAERAQATADEVRTLEGGTALAIAADAASDAEVARMLTEAVAGLGGLDAIVCNLGIGRGFGLAGTSAEDWDLVLATNLRSHFLCLKHGLALLPEGGAVVLVSSVAGHRAGSRVPAYDASKAGLSGLLRHATGEGMRRGVRVNAVVPGLIDTSLGRLATAQRPDRTRRLPFGRQGTAWEVAYATVFLLSDEAAYVAGLELRVDGGLLVL